MPQKYRVCRYHVRVAAQEQQYFLQEFSSGEVTACLLLHRYVDWAAKKNKTLIIASGYGTHSERLFKEPTAIPVPGPGLAHG